MIRMLDIRRSYCLGLTEVNALQGVSLEIGPHEFVAIMGPSGSGKSTLMNIIGFLDRPTAGAYFFEEQEVGRAGDDRLAELRNSRIGFVFQSFNLLLRYTALKNVELPMIYAGVAPRQRREAAAAALTEVGLADRMGHKPNEMSGGEQQRVAIARALVNRPAILLADEPTGNLDKTNSQQVHQLLLELNSEMGMAMVVVTHNMELAALMSRQATIIEGRLAYLS